MTPGWAWERRPASLLLGQPDARGVLIAATRDPDSTLTYVTVGGPRQEPLMVKIPATLGAATVVEREGRMLVELRRAGLGRVAGTVPRYVASLDIEGRPVLVSTALPGASMAVRYHSWRHTARPVPVARDFAQAGRWLEEFQTVTARADVPLTWAAEVEDELSGRWDGDPLLPAALRRVAGARERLGRHRTPVTAVHGDFRFDHLLTDEGRVSGVLDWDLATVRGCPLRDLVRFPLGYTLHLDDHSRHGHRVSGHPGLRREGVAPGVGYALTGSGWLPDLVRGFLGDGLARLGVPRTRWYDAALTGVAEVAATSTDDDSAYDHLCLLAALPERHPDPDRRSARPPRQVGQGLRHDREAGQHGPRIPGQRNGDNR